MTSTNTVIAELNDVEFNDLVDRKAAAACVPLMVAATRGGQAGTFNAVREGILIGLGLAGVSR